VYPGLDWRKLTASAFLARLNHMDFIIKFRNGTLSEREALERKAGEDNRTIFLMMRFKNVFKGYEEIK
jgi:hypothetical protein